MKAISVPFSAVMTNGLRLDTQLYMEAAFETTASLRPKVKAMARRAYWRKARRGLARIHNMEKWNRTHQMDGVEKLGG
jgi:hypothetical protein